MLMAASTLACRAVADHGDDARGLGLPLATLSEPQQVQVYALAARAAFDVGPDLTLLADTVLLPRWSGYAGGDAMPPAMSMALRRAGVVRGTCAPKRESAQRAPTCVANRAGYIARVSPIFQREGDTLLVYLLSEIFAVANGAGQQPFSFEMAYEMVPKGTSWRVVREGRVRQRGSAK